jgi:hypothetical protein
MTLAHLILGFGILAAAPTEPGGPAGPSSPPAQERLFERFFQDAAVEPFGAWLEMRTFLADLPGADAWGVQAIVATAPVEFVELGARLTFVNVDRAGRLNRLGIDDDTGLADVEVAAKLSLASALAVGVDLTIPTGDEDKGLGTGETDGSVFLAARIPLHGSTGQDAELALHSGVRFNDDATILGRSLNGRTSYQLGGGLQWPVAPRVTLLGEVALETERYRGEDEYAVIVGGLSWMLSGRLAMRPALTVGLTDDAPDWRLGVGLAYRPRPWPSRSRGSSASVRMRGQSASR